MCFAELYFVPLAPTRSEEYYEEAIADHFALEVGYEALEYLQKKKNFLMLPTKANLSVEKTFFISQAYAKCYATTMFSWKIRFTHPPNFQRVTRAMSNFAPFASAFGCKQTDRMVAQHPCKLERKKMAESHVVS